MSKGEVTKEQAFYRNLAKVLDVHFKSQETVDKVISRLHEDAGLERPARQIRDWSKESDTNKVSIFKLGIILSCADDPESLLRDIFPGLKIGSPDIVQELKRIHLEMLRMSQQIDDMEDRALGFDGAAARITFDLLQQLRQAAERSRVGQARRSGEPLGTKEESKFALKFSSTDRDKELLVAGILLDRHVEFIEPYSQRTWILTSRLDYGVEDSNVGRFFRIVCENLRRGHEYHFVVPKQIADSGTIRDYSIALKNQGISAEAISDRCSFHVLNRPVVSGFVILDIKRTEFEQDQPFLYKQLGDYFIRGNEDSNTLRLGYMMSPSKRLHASMLMDNERLEAAEKWWKSVQQDD